MKIYIIQNKEGKFFRSIGYGGCRSNWVSKMEDSKIYFKIGQAKSRVTFFFKRWPEFGCPHILEWEIQYHQAEQIDMEEETKKSIIKLERKRLKEEKNHLAYYIAHNISQKDQCEKEIARLEEKLKQLV